MQKRIFIFYLFTFFTCYNFSAQLSSFSPDIALYDDKILNIPPLKIEGFTLGMTFENFEALIKKKFDLNNIKKMVLKKTEPKLIVYNINTQSTEHYFFYIYGNFLAKIKIINLRPFELPEVIINRYIGRYNKPDNVWELMLNNILDFTGNILHGKNIINLLLNFLVLNLIC